jgi:hypothetical protein
MPNNVSHDITVNPRSVIVVSLLSIAYLLLSRFLVGYNPDQVVLLVICNVLFYSSKISRKFLIAYTTFLVYWIIFNYMKAFPNYRYAQVHISELYNLEKHLFGINFRGLVLTPNEYFKINSSTFLDVISGLFYICWVPVPFIFGIYLFFANRRECLLFALTFVLVNILGFIIYYLYPAAPPWYIQEHGFTFYPGTHEGPAGLVRFDNYFHLHIFQGIYTKGSNVFAAMPSLHSSYPIVVFYYALKNRLAWINIFFGIVMIGIWFAAVYTSHHYILDVMAGILCALAGIALFNFLMARSMWFKKSIDGYENLIK